MSDKFDLEATDNLNVEEIKSLNYIKEIYTQKEKDWIANNKKILKTIGHDIKTPMSSIINFLNLLKSGIYDFERSKIEHYVNIALQASHTTFILLDNLLEWAIVDDIKELYKPELIDFEELLEIEIKNLEIFTSSKKIRIHSQSSSNAFVFADKTMIKSILRNIIYNAIKYFKIFGKIVITTKNKGEFLEIAIKDEGVGINSEKLATLFNANNNISSAGTFNESGNGIGLLLCKEFIKIHKCKIWAISKPGEGSVFKFTLPQSMHSS